MQTASFILDELQSVASTDSFLGIPVPLTRNIAKANLETPLEELQILLHSPWHEARLCALLILVERFKKRKTTDEERTFIYQFYLKNTRRCNNWDLVVRLLSAVIFCIRQTIVCCIVWQKVTICGNNALRLSLP